MVVKKLCMTICMLIAMLIASTDGLSQEYYTLAEIKEQAKMVGMKYTGTNTIEKYRLI